MPLTLTQARALVAARPAADAAYAEAQALLAAQWPQNGAPGWLLTTTGIVTRPAEPAVNYPDSLSQGNLFETEALALAEADRRAQFQVLREQFGTTTDYSTSPHSYILRRGTASDNWITAQCTNGEFLGMQYFPTSLDAAGAAALLNKIPR